MAAAGLCSQVASAATLTGDYRFDDSFSSSVTGAADLQPVGTGSRFVTETVGCKPQRVLSFPKGAGVQVVNPNASDGDYSFVLLYRLSDLSGYRAIFHPSGLGTTSFGSDSGLYDRNGGLAVWNSETPSSNPYLGSAGVFEPGTYAELAFGSSSSKSATDLGFVDGAAALSYVGGDTGAFYASVMRFFKDNDPPGFTNEDSAGAVARIRIYDGILTPEEVADIYAADKLSGACDPSKRARATINRKVKVKNGRNGRLVVLTGIDVGCPDGGGTCNGSASVSKGRGSGRLAVGSRTPKRLGKAALSVKAGKTKKVKVKLTEKASDALRSRGKLKAKIKVKLSPPNGPPAVASRTAKLKPPR